MNTDIFAEVLYVFNRSLQVGEFPSGMKLANVTPVIKKGSLLASCLTYQKSLKDVYTSKFLIFLVPFCQIINTERTCSEALFNSPSREKVSKYRSRTRIWYSSN